MSPSLKYYILDALAHTPENYAMKETALIAEVSLRTVPRPTEGEVISAIRELDQLRYISGARHPLDGIVRWQITPNGRIALNTI